MTIGVLRRHRYDAYGVVLSEETYTPAAGALTDTQITSGLKYKGQTFDAETGQVYLRNRYYEPETGQFTQVDPARAGDNWYGYTTDPINRYDPSGLDWIDDSGPIVYWRPGPKGNMDHTGIPLGRVNEYGTRIIFNRMMAQEIGFTEGALGSLKENAEEQYSGSRSVATRGAYINQRGAVIAAILSSGAASGKLEALHAEAEAVDTFNAASQDALNKVTLGATDAAGVTDTDNLTVEQIENMNRWGGAWFRQGGATGLHLALAAAAAPKVGAALNSTRAAAAGELAVLTTRGGLTLRAAAAGRFGGTAIIEEFSTGGAVSSNVFDFARFAVRETAEIVTRRWGDDAVAVTKEFVETSARGPAKRTLPARTPNEAGFIEEFTTSETQTFFRVFSGDRRAGGFLTAVPPRSRAFAQEGLALPRANTAEFIQEVVVPAGTRLRRSRAAPIKADDIFPNRRGGAEQFELLDRIPLENFGPGRSLP